MIDDDAIFDALGASQRRQLLLDLFKHETQHVSELSRGTDDFAQAHETFLEEYLAGSMELPGVNKERLRLHHIHLPKLAQYGFIEWDREANIVLKGWRFKELTPILELLAKHGDDQPTELIV